MNNLEAWAITQGYDPETDYVEVPDGYLSPHFKASEFDCTGSCDDCAVNNAANRPPPILLEWLEAIREHFKGSPVVINSAFRCPDRNAAVGGAKGSQHLTGNAVDIRVAGVKPSAVYAFADQLIGDQGGVGRYETFTHIDARGSRARWSG